MGLRILKPKKLKVIITLTIIHKKMIKLRFSEQKKHISINFLTLEIIPYIKKHSMFSRMFLD